MKKTALTGLIVLIAIESVSACSYATTENVEFPQFGKIDGLYFLAAFILIVPIVFLYFLRARKGRWAIVTSAISLGLYIPALLLTAFVFAMCNSFIVPMQTLIRTELFLMLLILSIQTASWISHRKTAVKLR